ncbi:MAG: acetylglutamate kinase [Lachnospiraceae bacterium]|nr:acetylglutamate kinase [Lachnospiraceae bacterium]
MNMEPIIAKAETLIEALPYIRRFNDKIVVVKYGGSAMTDEDQQVHVIEDIAMLKSIGMHPVIVHGGGKAISKWVRLLGKEPEFIRGLRVTDEDTMEVAEMVLGRVNKYLVQLLENLGVQAVGISGKDASTIKCKKKELADGSDLGYVGEVTEVDPKLIQTLLDEGFVPIIAPVGVGADGRAYNINADDAATAVAEALHAEKLVFLTDTEGVYRDYNDKDSLISAISVDDARELIASGAVEGGMIPKIEGCLQAVENGVANVHILDGRLPHCLLLEFYTIKGVGTVFNKDGKP